MSIAKGYKQTEVGVIPEDWEVKRIIDISLLKSGLSITANEISEIGGYSCYGGNGLRGFTKKFTHNGKYPIIGRQGALCGNINYVEGKFFASEHAVVVSVNNQTDAKWLSYVMIRMNLNQYSESSAQPGLSVNKIGILKIPFPLKKNEQTAIANALSDMDALIAQTEKLIEKKKAIKQGVMQELLQPKEGWVTKKLGEVCEIIGGGTPSTFNSLFWNGDINWFTPSEVGKDKYLTSSKRKITYLGLVTSSARVLHAGTILLTTRASIGDLGILIFDAATNQGFQSIIPKTGINNEFIYYLMLTKKSELLQNASGSTFLEISPNKLKSIEVTLPTIEKQNEIASIFKEIDQTITLIETKLQKLKNQKQGMMQALLTGKIRLV